MSRYAVLTRAPAHHGRDHRDDSVRRQRDKRDISGFLKMSRWFGGQPDIVADERDQLLVFEVEGGAE